MENRQGLVCGKFANLEIKMRKIVWASDLHFDHARSSDIQTFFNRVKNSGANMLVICGDISGGTNLSKWLARLELELDIDIRFVLGNHDFYGSSFDKIYQEVKDIVKNSTYNNNGFPILKWLTDNVIETISDGVALIGHDGWYDTRTGITGKIIMNDFRFINDFKTSFFVSPVLLHDKIKEIADISTTYINKTISEVLKTYSKVILVTHVPPFSDAAWYDGRTSGPEFLPYYCATNTGKVLREHMKNNPDKELLVLCGHTHGEGEVDILPNLKVKTAGAEYGYPDIQGVIDV